MRRHKVLSAQRAADRLSVVNSLFGIETEYGIAVEGCDATGLVNASRDVVKSYRGKFAGPWNYRAEDPRNDVRGFHVDKLSQDATDAQFDKPGERAASPEEDRCDRVLVNGGRVYNDHGHPEYSTPECCDLRSLIAHDKAGERIVQGCAHEYSRATGRVCQIVKNNTDYHGASYGTHESYLMKRETDWNLVVRNMATFLATRILYAGAGNVGCEDKTCKATYQLSQRADFFSTLQSVDTLANRPLINTRDEAHGDERRFRRLHVISGDANLAEYSTALRVGATNLVVALTESGWEVPVVARDPVRAIKNLSRDEQYRWLIETDDGDYLSAIDVQRCYLRAARELELDGSEWILDEWESTLNALDSEPALLADRLDWIAKKMLLDEYVEAEGLDWEKDAPTLQSLELAYHDVNPAHSLFYGLVESGAMQVLVSEKEIESALVCPPINTRAALRGVLVRRFADKIKSLSWGAVLCEENGETIRLPLPEAREEYSLLASQIESAMSVRDVAAILRAA
jgi:proteasome accessory factor A